MLAIVIEVITIKRTKNKFVMGLTALAVLGFIAQIIYLQIYVKEESNGLD
jgi:hypothetical protein